MLAENKKNSITINHRFGDALISSSLTESVLLTLRVTVGSKLSEVVIFCE